MIIHAQIDTAALIRRLKNGERRLAYGVVEALNNTAKRVQEAERERVLGTLEVRKRDFILREIAKIAFASVKKGLLYAEVYVGQKPRLLLSTLEAGGTKESARGNSVAVPITGSAARPSFPSSVPEQFFFRKLRLRRTSRKAGASRILKGEQGTYVVPGVGVFRRFGEGPDGTELIYAFKKTPRLKAQLGFVHTARATIDRWLREEIERVTIKALERSRGQGL